MTVTAQLTEILSLHSVIFNISNNKLSHQNAIFRYILILTYYVTIHYHFCMTVAS